MSALELFWHVLGFFSPALGVGLVAPAIAKLVWRRELRAVRFARLAACTTAACAAALAAGLLIFGRDGRMVTYAAVIVASALALWWSGLRRS